MSCCRTARSSTRGRARAPQEGELLDASTRWPGHGPSRRPRRASRHNGSAVLLPLLPPSYTPRVMNFGGGDPATNTTEIIDLSAASPSWTPGPNMSTGRIQMNASHPAQRQGARAGRLGNNEHPRTRRGRRRTCTTRSRTPSAPPARQRSRGCTTRRAAASGRDRHERRQQPGAAGRLRARDRDLHAALSVRRERPPDHDRSSEHHEHHAQLRANRLQRRFLRELHEHVADQSAVLVRPGSSRTPSTWSSG